MEFEQILQLIDHVSDSKLTSFHYDTEDVKLSMECGQVQTVLVNGAAPASETIVAQEAVQPGSQEKAEKIKGNIVKSPLVGTFYAAPAEDAAPFVAVGDTVKNGQVLAIVEAMKLMNDIESDFEGKITEIYVENGQAVEYGQPLFCIA